MVELLLCISGGRLAKKSILYYTFFSAATPNTFDIDYGLIDLYPGLMGPEGISFNQGAGSAISLSFYYLIISLQGSISASLLMSLRMLDATACTAELTISLMPSTYFCVAYCFSCMKEPTELPPSELLFGIAGLGFEPSAPYFCSVYLIGSLFLCEMAGRFLLQGWLVIAYCLGGVLFCRLKYFRQVNQAHPSKISDLGFFLRSILFSLSSSYLSSLLNLSSSLILKISLTCLTDLLIYYQGLFCVLWGNLVKMLDYQSQLYTYELSLSLYWAAGASYLRTLLILSSRAICRLILGDFTVFSYRLMVNSLIEGLSSARLPVWMMVFSAE